MNIKCKTSGSWTRRRPRVACPARRARFVTESVQIGVFNTRLTAGVIVIADLDTVPIALYVALTDRIIPSLGLRRRGPGRPPEVTSVCCPSGG
jgi:hypothetical protein